MKISETGRWTETRVWLTAHYRSVSWWFCSFTSGCREWGRPRIADLHSHTIPNKWFTDCGQPLLFVTISIYYCYYHYFPAHRHAHRRSEINGDAWGNHFLYRQILFHAFPRGATPFRTNTNGIDTLTCPEAAQQIVVHIKTQFIYSFFLMPE